MKILEFWFKIHRDLFPRLQLSVWQHWFRHWLVAEQATSQCLNKWWLIYWRIYSQSHRSSQQGSAIWAAMHLMSPVTALFGSVIDYTSSALLPLCENPPYRGLHRTGIPVMHEWLSGHFHIKHIEAETKWPPFRRRRFQRHFLEWKCMNFDWNSIEVCS